MIECVQSPNTKILLSRKEKCELLVSVVSVDR